jgi:hypothetical protein
MGKPVMGMSPLLFFLYEKIMPDSNKDLCELIQDDIITAMDSYGDGIVDTLCQIVVDRFEEFENE